MDSKHSSGCRDNFYNHSGNSITGQCWMLEKAVLVKRVGIGHWENPPYKGKKVVTVPSCWHGEGSNRTHYIDPKKIDAQGYIR